MKTKFVKLAVGLAKSVAPAVAPAVVEGLTATQLEGLGSLIGGNDTKSPGAKFLGQTGEEAKKQQDVPFENFKGVSLEIETLKDDFLSNGFGSQEFDSYLPDYFNLQPATYWGGYKEKVPTNPKAINIPTTVMVDLMKLAKETAYTTNTGLKSIFNAIIDLVNKNVNFNLVKDVIPSAAKLDAKARGIGVFQSLLNAMHGDVSGSTLLMFMLPEEDMRSYNSILARALGHKLSAAEEIRKSTDISKLSLQKATEEHGLVRGLQVGLESQEINAIEENFTKQLTGLFRDTPVGGLMSIARRAMMLYHVYSNIKDQFLGGIAPSTVPARSVSTSTELKFVKKANYPSVQNPTSTPTTNPAATPMGRPTNAGALSNTLNSQNTPPSVASNTLIRALIEMNQSIIDGNRAGNFARLKGLIPGYTSAAITSSANPNLINTAKYWFDQFTTTGGQTALFDPNDIKELVQGLTNNSVEAEKLANLTSQLKMSTDNYDKRKSNLYGGGEEGAGKLTTDVMEFGQAKKVPYNTVSQNLARLNEFKTSVEDVLKIANELQAQFARVRTFPLPANLTAEQRTNLVRGLDSYAFKLKSQVEKWKSERVKVQSELATIKQTTKQKDIRFFNSEKARTLKELAKRNFGGYGMMGGIAQLNTLMAPLIQEQKDKIANITAEMNAATNPEDQRAFKGQLQLAQNELQGLLAEGPNMLLDGLEGKFDDTNWTGAFASVSGSKFIKTSKYNKEADERLEDYYNEEMDYSPYGTALEHPLENKGVLTENIKPHKKSKYKKYKFHIK
jgi:hypothetical protein